MKQFRFVLFVLIGIPFIVWAAFVVIGADLLCNIVRFNKPTDWDLTIALKDSVLELFKGEDNAG